MIRFPLVCVTFGRKWMNGTWHTVVSIHYTLCIFCRQKRANMKLNHSKKHITIGNLPGIFCILIIFLNYLIHTFFSHLSCTSGEVMWRASHYEYINRPTWYYREKNSVFFFLVNWLKHSCMYIVFSELPISANPSFWGGQNVNIYVFFLVFHLIRFLFLVVFIKYFDEMADWLLCFNIFFCSGYNSVWHTTHYITHLYRKSEESWLISIDLYIFQHLCSIQGAHTQCTLSNDITHSI